MAQIIWTEPALSDLSNIAEYISVNNLEAAECLVSHVFQMVDRLEAHPRSGKKIEEHRAPSYREIVVNPCRVFYKIEKESVFILHVMRQEQRLKSYIFERANK